MNTVIIGASNKPERYSYKAKKMLSDHGHLSFLIHPSLSEIEGQKVYPSLEDIDEKIHTITMYVKPEISSNLYEQIIKMKPSRVIFNPGSENINLAKKLKDAGIECTEACTLVLLSTDQY